MLFKFVFHTSKYIVTPIIPIHLKSIICVHAKAKRHNQPIYAMWFRRKKLIKL